MEPEDADGSEVLWDQQLSVKMDGPHAEALGSIYSVMADLARVREFCQAFVQLSADDQAPSAIVDALWVAAVVTYCRCFGEGVRNGLKDRDVRRLGIDGGLAFHKSLQDVRNKHIAHSVSDLEQIVAGAMLTPPQSGERTVLGVSAFMTSLVIPAVPLVQQLDELCGRLLAVLKERLVNAHALLLAEAQAMNIDELYRQPPLRIQIAGDAARLRGGRMPRRRSR